jgi:thiamine biosynthesis lipoprotein
VEGLADRDVRDERAESDAAARRRPPGYLVQISRPAMATEFQILLIAAQHAGAPEAALEALDRVQSLEEQLTVYREHSEVSALNQQAATSSVKLDSVLFELLEQCLALHEQTEGAFDITSGPLSKTWGFFRRQGRFPQQEDVALTLGQVGSRWLELDREARTIRFTRPGVQINFNAIGKGYAIDRCVEILRGAGIREFLIHGGQSSVFAAGDRDPDPAALRGWTVALRHPLRYEQHLAEIQLRDRAIGTSGSGTQFFYHQGRRYGHVLDPRTGWPAEGVLSATVVAPTAALADGLSTAFYVMGLEKTRAFCADRADIAAVLVCPGERSGSIAMHSIGMQDEDWRRLE